MIADVLGTAVVGIADALDIAVLGELHMDTRASLACIAANREACATFTGGDATPTGMLVHARTPLGSLHLGRCASEPRHVSSSVISDRSLAFSAFNRAAHLWEKAVHSASSPSH